ncbi:hypothetical protein [Serratia entomophila]|uniref:hypothetical protein n=1 Tax=Serratia entomophila TaxID=42906 RepID=UPI002179EF7B|nr:hypothetical protein [Serratia entomophila]CAI1059161.1 Uncharacterised protein [Serratia entomophila]CAI1063751.1 Uncharacterised protein [Serratia entomophila]CAI1114734.1 Uncharacterised protein [Serratia entomophila]CAI1889384.1 Uncharacterised protein [Serratia entomophila]CAI1917189.1 Uncharacterised protein [Serratia entomophila]
MTKTHTVFCRSVLLCLLGGSLLLSGCEAPKRPAVAIQSASDPTPEQSLAAREAEQLALCQKELAALKPVDAKQQQTFQQAFSRLMSGAAQYASVRAQTNSGTQETVDALYRYKVKRLCANISQALLTGLAGMGERVT